MNKQGFDNQTSDELKKINPPSLLMSFLKTYLILFASFSLQ
jgi:hypothetical protein